jgi:hypothetical protein
LPKAFLLQEPNMDIQASHLMVRSLDILYKQTVTIKLRKKSQDENKSRFFNDK